MKIKAYSWMLAGAYLICGIALFLIIPKCDFSGFARPLPFLTRAALALGSFGWLGLALAAGALVILKDLRFRSRLLSVLLTVVLGVWICCMAIGLFLPFTWLVSQQQARALPPNQSRGCVKSAGAKIGNDQILVVTHFDEMSRRIRWSKNEFSHSLSLQRTRRSELNFALRSPVVSHPLSASLSFGR